jgi:hypothetical protein
MKKFILLLALFLSACAGLGPMMDSDFKHEFTYDYTAAGKSKTEIWTAARNFMALTYNDSTKVIKVADETNGTLIGSAIIGWQIAPYSSVFCKYDYSIKFAAKDGKARLQLDLLNPIGGCGWDRPSEAGYQQITAQFNEIGAKLGETLTNSNKQLFKDF